MGYRLVELCCGSAALTLSLCGARRSLLPYQGSKWRFRKLLARHLAEAGFTGAPSRVTLFDPGPWGRVMPVVLDPSRRAELVAMLRTLAERDPHQVYTGLHQHPVPSAPVRYAAEYLFLQRLAYSGKAVGVRDGRWSSPGFNTSSAYGLPGTERFGQVKPMVPSLVRVLEGYQAQLEAVPVDGGQQPAPGPDALDGPVLVYFDPPYAGSTRYPNGSLSREEVVALALAWHAAGATVFISEGEPLPGLVDQGWTARPLDAGRADTSPFRGKQAEWLTVSPEPR